MLKKMMAVLMVLSMVSVMFISSVYSAEVKTAKAYEGTPKIDAEVDTIWSNAPAITDFLHTGEPIMHVDTDIKPTIRLMWDDKNLYVLIQVKDKGVYGDAPGGEAEWTTSISNNDGFELYFDADNDKSILYKPQDRNIKFDYRGKFWVVQGPSTGIVAKAKKTSDGYIIETSLAWTKSMKAGDKAGIDFCINDNQDGKSGRVTWISWLDGNSWQSPSSMGIFELVAAAKAVGTTAPAATGSKEPASTPNNERSSNQDTSSNPVTGDYELYFFSAAFIMAGATMLILFKKRRIA